MPLEKQVASLELSKRLKELGVKQEGIFAWSTEQRWDQQSPFLYLRKGHTSEDDCKYLYTAFTVAELGEMLPRYIFVNGKPNWLTQKWDDDGLWLNYDADRQEPGIARPSGNENDTEADSRAKMVIYLLKNGMMKVPNGEPKNG